MTVAEGRPLEAALRTGLRALGLTLTDAQVGQLLDYLDLIGKWTRVYNLTAVRDPQEMLTHHLLDSLAAVAPLDELLRADVLEPAHQALADHTYFEDEALQPVRDLSRRIRWVGVGVVIVVLFAAAWLARSVRSQTHVLPPGTWHRANTWRS